MPTAAANGIDLYYERSGDGPPAAVLQRLGRDARDERSCCSHRSPSASTSSPTTSAASAAPRSPTGRTRWPTTRPTPPPCSTTSAGTTCRVVGISFGGMVAQELAVTWPERVERLALLCTSPGRRRRLVVPAARAGRPAPRTQAAIGAAAPRHPVHAPSGSPPTTSTGCLVEMLAAAPRSRASDEQRRGEHGQLEARRHHDVWDRLARIACPTLVAGGPLRRHRARRPTARPSRRAIPGAELRVYEGGHAFFVQDPGGAARGPRLPGTAEPGRRVRAGG